MVQSLNHWHETSGGGAGLCLNLPRCELGGAAGRPRLCGQAQRRCTAEGLSPETYASLRFAVFVT